MERPLIFSGHAILRMAQRRIATLDVRHVLVHGEEIESYPNDTPYPSRLVLGFVAHRPLHVVAANNPSTNETIVISLYEPDPNQWDSTLRRRKRP
ncbi:MAG: DUF4258 domain-containing protein [Candidatus Schekmanbacteria bacterium]|nr:DUF4258 domain-containing protein [Candidatus Schekmanbacteria bacterium]